MSLTDATQLLKEAEGKIKTLIAEERLLEAHRACMEVLRFDPQNIKIIKLKNKIEKKVKKHNIVAIKEDIKTLKPLLKEKKFKELLKHLKGLEPYIEEYTPLKKFIIKSQRLYEKQKKQEEIIKLQSTKQQIDKYIKDKKFKDALREAETLRLLHIKQKEIKQIITKVKEYWVDKELQDNKKLLSTERFEDILLYLQGLIKITGQYKKLNNLIKNYKKKRQEQLIEEKKDFIYTGTERIKTLLQLKKFDKAADASKEILEIDPANKKVRKIYLSASRKEIKRLNRKLLRQIIKSKKEIKKEYKKNKKDYIKL